MADKVDLTDLSRRVVLLSLRIHRPVNNAVDNHVYKIRKCFIGAAFYLFA